MVEGLRRCDGLKGFPKAIEAVFPDTLVHQCVVHLVRQSLRTVNWKERGKVAESLKGICLAPGKGAALHALEAFELGELGRRYPEIPALWRRHWERVAPAPIYPVSVQRMLYSNHAIESLNATLRKSLKTRGHFPNQDAAAKLLYIAPQHAVPRLRSNADWHEAMRHISPCPTAPKPRPALSAAPST